MCYAVAAVRETVSVWKHLVGCEPVDTLALQVCSDKGSYAACLLDTKGPEIRTAMLRGGKDIELVAGQKVRTPQ
jgi:hypothetical protein